MGVNCTCSITPFYYDDHCPAHGKYSGKLPNVPAKTKFPEKSVYYTDIETSPAGSYPDALVKMLEKAKQKVAEKAEESGQEVVAWAIDPDAENSVKVVGYVAAKPVPWDHPDADPLGDIKKAKAALYKAMNLGTIYGAGTHLEELSPDMGYPAYPNGITWTIPMPKKAEDSESDAWD